MIQLLPFKYKLIGLIFIVCASCLTGLYFYYGIRIEIPVFALFSSYLETKFFTFFKTNFIEEIIMLLFLAGFSFIVFSKEKNEKKWLTNIRIRALGNTIKIFVGCITISILFIYGSAFITVLTLNMVLPFVIYIIVFYSLKSNTTKRRRIRILQQKLFKS